MMYYAAFAIETPTTRYEAGYKDGFDDKPAARDNEDYMLGWKDGQESLDMMTFIDTPWRTGTTGMEEKEPK